MARTKKQGYTLIEMMVVTVILALFAALVAPSYVNMRDGQQRRAFYTSVVDLAGNARELAIVHHATMYLKVDTSLNRVAVMQEINDSTFQPADGSTGTSAPAATSVQSSNSSNQDNTPQANIATTPNDHSNDTTQLTLPLPSGIQFGNFQLAGTASDSSSWKVRYYADGTSDSGAMELSSNGAIKSLVVNHQGGAKLVDGTIPDTSQDKWIAGTYVQRQQ